MIFGGRIGRRNASSCQSIVIRSIRDEIPADQSALMSTLSVPLFVPPLNLTTDNAAMIGAAGAVSFARGIRAGSNLEAEPFAAIGV